MKKHIMLLGLSLVLSAAAFLCGCHRAVSVTGVWHSKVGDEDTLHLRNDGSWQLDTVVWAKGKSYPMIYGGHYNIVDPNHIKFVVEVSNGTNDFTSEYFVTGSELSLGDFNPPHTKMLQYRYISQ